MISPFLCSTLWLAVNHGQGLTTVVLTTYYEHSVDSQAIAETPNLAKHVVLTVSAMFAASEFSTETRLAVRYCHPSIALCTPMGDGGFGVIWQLTVCYEHPLLTQSHYSYWANFSSVHLSHICSNSGTWIRTWSSNLTQLVEVEQSCLY